MNNFEFMPSDRDILEAKVILYKHQTVTSLFESILQRVLDFMATPGYADLSEDDRGFWEETSSSLMMAINKEGGKGVYTSWGDTDDVS